MTTARWCLALVMGLLLTFAFTGGARAADAIGVELHEWSLWIVDPTLAQANAKDHYPNNLPVFVESVRSRLPGREENRPSPLGMMTFYGDPAKGVEVEMQLAASSRFLAHWPPAESKSKRIRWLELDAGQGARRGRTRRAGRARALVSRRAQSGRSAVRQPGCSDGSISMLRHRDLLDARGEAGRRTRQIPAYESRFVSA